MCKILERDSLTQERNKENRDWLPEEGDHLRRGGRCCKVDVMGNGSGKKVSNRSSCNTYFMATRLEDLIQ